MLKFKTFLTEGNMAKNNARGVLHEVLVGHYLQGGKHMSQFKGKNGQSAEEQHNQIVKSGVLDKKEISRAHAQAKSAAGHLKKHIESKGHTVSHASWTSKPGDLHSATGVHAKQDEDASDIVVHTHQGHHHGVSLKISNGTSKHIPVSNMGMNAGMHKEASKMASKHKEQIKKAHPGIPTSGGAKARKEWARANPKSHEKVKEANRKFLNASAGAHAKELNDHLSSGNHDHVHKHLKRVLSAHPTPMEKEGKGSHIRHLTFRKGKEGHDHHATTAHGHLENITKDKNWHKHVEIKHSGSSVSYHYKGKRFAVQPHKFDSQSDPLSTLKSVGNTAGDHH